MPDVVVSNWFGDITSRPKVVVEAKTEAADPATRTAAGAELVRHVKSRIGVTTEVDVAPPGAVDRSLGKAKRIVDFRPKG